MTNKDLNFFKSMLVRRKEELLNSCLSAFHQIMNTGQKPSDEGDFAVEEVRQYISCKMHSRDRMYLLEVERAFSRMEDGQFGVCEECGVAISRKRLKAQPFSSLCVDCKEDVELEQKRLA